MRMHKNAYKSFRRSILRGCFTLLTLLLLTAANLPAQSTGQWQTWNGSAKWSSPTLDVTQFTGDIGTATAACVSALASTGGTCDARNLSTSITEQISSQLVLSGTSNKPIIWLLSPAAVITCTTSTSPCIAFGNNIGIQCGTNESNQMCMVQTTNSAQTILGPANPSGNTSHLSIRGVSFSNNSTAASAPVVDLTNTSYATIENSFIGHSGGSGSGLFITVQSPGSAFYNSVMNTRFYMTGNGDAIDVRNGANELKVFGGEIQNSACAVSVTNTTGGGTDGLHLFGTSAEVYTDAALCSKPTTGTVYSVDWVGGRFESATGTVVDIVPTGMNTTTSRFYMIANNINGTAGNDTTHDPTHAVTWLFSGSGLGASDLPDTLTTSHTIGVKGVNQLSGANLAGTKGLSGTTGTVTFSPAFNVAPICTATDTTGASAVQVSTSPTTLTLTGGSGHTISYICIGNPN